MDKPYKSFLLKLFIFSAVIGLISFILKWLLPAGTLSPSLPFLVIYFFIISAVVHYALLKSTTYSARRFVSYFMLATFVKFFIYVITVFAYAYFNRSDLLPFVISFFVLYILYTIFEVLAIIKKAG
jgi:hypothetical protein